VRSKFYAQLFLERVFYLLADLNAIVQSVFYLCRSDCKPLREHDARIVFLLDLLESGIVFAKELVGGAIAECILSNYSEN